MLLRILTLLALLAATSLTAGEPAVPGTKIPDFTFIHASDCHVPPGVARRTGPAGGPQFGTAEVVAQIKGLTDPIELRPYGVTVPAPSFALSTGDNTEFGGLDRVWEQYLGLWQDAPFPVFHVLGNHDNTWAAQRHRIRELHGSTYYSFNRHGCHFIGWDSATPQDPRPSFGEEGLEWLRADLKGVDPATPVFLFLHHPLNSTEFASSYERDRLLDLLRPYNLALLLVGHGHTAQRRVVAGVDQVMGGSTFGAAPGYSVVSVKDGVLRVAYRKAWEEAPLQPLLERPLNARPVYPAIRISAPAEGATITEPARIRVTIDRDDIVSARWQADDEKGREGELARAGAAWEASLNAREWEPGAHTLRLVFKSGGGAEYQRTTRFYTAGQQPRVLWRAFMKGSGKGSPVVD
ncbi:MAG TPA: metallophosphoesterase, partial [Armatimonadota bacterium]|nr:metallophosphoesterase [Armatimonadota bacterium]